MFVSIPCNSVCGIGNGPVHEFGVEASLRLAGPHFKLVVRFVLI